MGGPNKTISFYRRERNRKDLKKREKTYYKRNKKTEEREKLEASNKVEHLLTITERAASPSGSSTTTITEKEISQENLDVQTPSSSELCQTEGIDTELNISEETVVTQSNDVDPEVGKDPLDGNPDFDDPPIPTPKVVHPRVFRILMNIFLTQKDSRVCHKNLCSTESSAME